MVGSKSRVVIPQYIFFDLDSLGLIKDDISTDFGNLNLVTM